MRTESGKINGDAPMQIDDALADAEPVTLEDMEREFLDKPFSGMPLADLEKTMEALGKMIERAKFMANKLELTLKIASDSGSGGIYGLSSLRKEERLLRNKVKKYDGELAIINGLIAAEQVKSQAQGNKK